MHDRRERSSHLEKSESALVQRSPAVEADRGGGLIVDDGRTLAPGQMHKSAFMARVRVEACEAADEELRRAGRSTDGCPYVARWLAYYDGRSAADVERAVRRYAPPGGATRAADYLPAVRARVGHAAAQFVLHGTIPTDLMADQASAPAEGAAIARAADGTAASSAPTAAELGARLGPGRPLDAASRGRMERALGHSFARVRVHDDAGAAAAARDVGARAFAFGDHVAFAGGAPRPGTPHGDALLAHELAHTVQQTGAPAPAGPLPVDDDVALEAEADAIAHGAVATLHGREPARIAPARRAMRLSRCKSEEEKLRERAAALAKELATVIAGADWKTGIRPRVYPKESAAGLARAKKRHLGQLPDMTGLGSNVRLDHFAAAMHKLQGDWTRLGNAVARKAALKKALDAELAAAGVPPIDTFRDEPMDSKGYFQQGSWTFVIDSALVRQDVLSDADATEVTNTAMHEGRHAEQAFLAARYYAGQHPRANKRQVSDGAQVPEHIAAKAIAAKFTAATNADVAELGKRMYQAGVVDRDVNQHISDDDYTAEMKTARAAAQKALDAMKATPTAETIAKAELAKATLEAAIAEVERRYTLYRNIPYEADAHEVGDAAGEAFKGWP